MRILITGANGFVGRCLTQNLKSKRFHITPVVRVSNGNSDEVAVGNIGPNTNWRPILLGVDVVIHLAARVHKLKEDKLSAEREYHQVNVEGTLNLAQQAAEMGVKRFVFLSSIKVNGESTLPNKPFTPSDIPHPVGYYAKSKLEAETGLIEISQSTGMDFVIIRPTLVYGPGVRANFLSIVLWLKKRIPLPLGAINNRRSFVGIDNLIDLIVNCVEQPGAANQIFLVSDGHDLSTTELIQRIARTMGQEARLISISPKFLRGAAWMLGQRELSQRLLGNLQVDISKTRHVLGWNPPVNVDDGLKKAVREFAP